MDREDAPTLAECQRDEAEARCARTGHIVCELDEDGTIGCDRCGAEALDLDEPSDPAEEPEPGDDLQQAWAQADLDRIRLSDLGSRWTA